MQAGQVVISTSAAVFFEVFHLAVQDLHGEIRSGQCIGPRSAAAPVGFREFDEFHARNPAQQLRGGFTKPWPREAWQGSWNVTRRPCSVLETGITSDASHSETSRALAATDSAVLRCGSFSENSRGYFLMKPCSSNSRSRPRRCDRRQAAAGFCRPACARQAGRHRTTPEDRSNYCQGPARCGRSAAAAIGWPLRPGG